jgi:selenocysteine-specific elongation factor
MHVIGTAGHVDHGKSTLIRALTGMEPDRWAEEKRRGLTIDLGYAWTTLPGGTEVAFVDVPGHQRFITNMLAGIGPVPAVLFVVAADRGWSAQSAQHLDALVALGVQHGVLAITRSDLGDAELAEAEARDFLVGTGLADVEAVAVSPVDGTGLDDLTAALERMTARLPDATDKPTRLWVDRVFTIRGAGTVVTGTLCSGVIRTGDELVVHPDGTPVRIRAIESLKQSVDEVSGVARVALNLRNIKASDVRRGDALTAPGSWADVGVVDARLVPDATKAETNLVLHLGSAAVAVRVRPLGDDTVRLTLATPLPIHVGERAVLRDPGSQRVVAGAVVLDTMPPTLNRRGAAKSRAGELAGMTGVPDAAAEVRRRGAVRSTDLIAAGIAVDVDAVPAAATLVGDWLVDSVRWQDWQQSLVAFVDAWAAAHPLQPGIPRQALAGQLGLPDSSILEPLLKQLPDLVSDADGVHRRDAVAALTPDIELALVALAQRLAADPFDAAEVPELVAAGLTGPVLAVALRTGRLVRIDHGVYLGPGALDEAVRRLAGLEQPFTMSEARQALGTTRRVAVPLLELLDRTRRTQRLDSQRRVVRS